MKKLFIGALLLSLSLGAFAQYQREAGPVTVSLSSTSLKKSLSLQTR